MKLQGPYKYEISVQGQDSYSVSGPNNATTFVAPVTKRGPKLYVFSDGGNLIYIGQTVQGMSARMRLGFKADGTGGYWGYSWRNALAKSTLHIWCLEDATEEEELEALECIESEVVYSYRSTNNQWPKYQTEIHFHESTEEHRNLANAIIQAIKVGA
ncbi:MAG: hypothetical protein AABZ50_00785 [Pseudomonadota bacterium]